MFHKFNCYLTMNMGLLMYMKVLFPGRWFASSTLLAVCVLLMGCGMSGSAGNGGGSALGSSSVTIGVNGSVHGGQNPVLGGTIQLYQVGTTGYSSHAVPLLATPATTNAAGSFSITGQYTCTSGSYLYITSSGGSPQISSNPTTNNNNITLAAALGLCDNLTASTFIIIDEVTTVAAAYALAQFSQGTIFGQTMLSQPGSASSAPADNFATSSTNLTGLANAMAISQVLASNASGSSPGNNSNSSAIPEWWQVNLIANMLAACVNSTGGMAGDGSPCGTLFGNVKGTTPADTLQAALDLALNPAVTSTGITNLYNLIPPTAPFQPYPVSAAAITDFSIGIQYQPVSGATKLLSQPSGISIDSLGNAWIGNVPHSASSSTTAPSPSFLAELTPTGVPVQAGSTAGNYLINNYSVSGTPTAMSGQVWFSTPNYILNGLLVPSIDTTNNVWFNDRQNGVIAEVTGSGTAYSSSQSYSNGGNAGAVGNAIPPNGDGIAPVPVSTYLDGNNSVWFNMGGTDRPVSCGVGFNTGTSGVSVNGGLGVFFNENTSTIYTGKSDNIISNNSNGYIVVDPNKNDVTGTTPIPGAPFVWTLGVNTTANLIHVAYSQSAGSGTSQYPLCNLPPSAIGIIANTAPGSTDTTVNPGHSTGTIPDIPNPALSGDYLHYMAKAQDWSFDKFGNLWVANTNQINTTTTAASEIFSSITKLTPAYGTTLNSSSSQNFTFSIFHGVAGLRDGSTITNFPQFLTTDGAGNVWFALNNSPYLNAITNTGTALSPNGTSSTAGFAGSSCACTFNGVAQTYQRPNLTITRPAVDLSGNIWVPVTGVGSAYVDVLVGIAVPRVNPDSVGLASGNFASQP
jgi:hypothetical protein